MLPMQQNVAQNLKSHAATAVVQPKYDSNPAARAACANHPAVPSVTPYNRVTFLLQILTHRAMHPQRLEPAAGLDGRE